MKLPIALLFFTSVSTQFVEFPTNISSKIGESATFRCISEKSTEPIIYSQWKSNTGSLLGYHQESVLPGHGGRYSYTKPNSEELHLKITNINLDDDGEYECQMLHPKLGPIRAKASLNVIVPPHNVHFANHQESVAVSVREQNILNLTCVVPNVKPEPVVLWYLDNKMLTDNVHQSVFTHLNKTATIHSNIILKPDHSDHGKIVRCEAAQEETGTKKTANMYLDILYPSSDPVVEVIGGSNILKIGENVSLSCKVVGGNPQPDVNWYAGNSKLKSHLAFDTHLKQITNVYSFVATRNDNKAEYECRANNSINENIQKSSLKLEVEYAPFEVKLHGDTLIREGSNVKFECKSSPANPASDITWIVDGKPFPTFSQKETEMKNGYLTSSNIIISSNNFLKKSNKIYVECVATNSEGKASLKQTIGILVPPKQPKIEGFSNSPYFEGDIVNVTCEAEGGNPLAQLSWFRNSDMLNGGETRVNENVSISSLLFKVNRKMNGQKLRCEASNSATDDPLVKSHELVVYYLPQKLVIKTLSGQENQFRAGKPAKLLCGSTMSNPLTSLTWKSPFPNNHSKLENSKSEKAVNSEFAIENALTFIPTDDDDGTLIHCIANHSEWKSSANTSYVLNVIYPPKALVSSPITVMVSEGDSFKENITIRANPSIASWEWKKNEIQFEHTLGNIFARGAVLSGRHVKKTDSGIYTVTASNALGSTHISIHLGVQYRAKITSISTPIIAEIGDTVYLECEAEGEPSSIDMVQWYRNGQKMLAHTRGSQKSVLQLNATQNLSGEYTCIASNGIGVPEEAKTYLLINSAPTVIHESRFSKVAGPLGSVVKAVCKVKAVPTVEFFWESDQQLIKTNNSKYSFFSRQLDFSTYQSTLWIKNVGPSDYTTTLRCIAKNNFGVDSISIPLIPPTNPEMPKNLSLANSTMNTISITWDPQFDGGSEQIFEIKYRKHDSEIVHLVNTSNANLRLSGLSSSTSYVFQMRSLNTRGFASSWTSPYLLSTLDSNGNNILHVQTNRYNFSFVVLITIVSFVIIILTIFIFCCLMCNRHRKRELRAKIENVRSNIGGDIRQVQMYGTMAPANQSRQKFEEFQDLSEDDHSVKTMIEVSPNGFMQPINPILYENSDTFEYGYQMSPFASNDRKITYSNVPYPEPPFHQNDWLAEQAQKYNPNPPHHLSTFINPSIGVRSGPIELSQLDGDLV